MTIEQLQEKVDIVMSIIPQKEESRFIATIGGKNLLYIMFDKRCEEIQESTIKFIHSYGFTCVLDGMCIQADCLPSEFEVYAENFPKPNLIKVEKSTYDNAILPPLNVYRFGGVIHHNDKFVSYNLHYEGEYHKGLMTKREDGWSQSFGVSILGEYVKWLIEKKNILKQ